jgi:hypothetical protein
VTGPFQGLKLPKEVIDKIYFQVMWSKIVGDFDWKIS